MNNEIVSRVWNRADQEPFSDRCNAVIARPAIIRVPHTTGVTTLPFPVELAFISDSYRSEQVLLPISNASQIEGVPEHTTVAIEAPSTFTSAAKEKHCKRSSSSLTA